MTGAPTIIPTANAEIRYPACGMVTARSAAISGSSPAIMNSLVPSAKTQAESTVTTRGTRAGASRRAMVTPTPPGIVRFRQ